jgi:hypothetical protein
MSNNKMTDTELILKKTIYPRYTHHIFATQYTSPNIYYQFNAITKDMAYENSKGKNISPYLLNVAKNFNPMTVLRKEPAKVEVVKTYTVAPTVVSSLALSVASAVTGTQTTQETKTETITESILKPIINDTKFLCASQPSYAINKYYNFYVEPASKPYVKPGSKFSHAVAKVDSDTKIETETEVKVEIEKKVEIKKRVDDSILYKGNNNTDVNILNQLVNIYTLADISNNNNYVVNDVICYLARLDTYIDPTISPIDVPVSITDNSQGIGLDASTDPTSPYYGMPRVYPIGIIPADYSQCATTDEFTPIQGIDNDCRGQKYINGVDYSDARKIDFEVACVQLNPM